MHSDGRKQRPQQLEQVMTTIFACRSVVKYNLSLSEEQREEILQDIDVSLEMLQTYMLENMTVQPHLNSLSYSQIPGPTSARVRYEPLKSGVKEQETLRALYRLYHAYLDTNRHPNLQSFVSRFNEVVSVLGDIHRFFVQEPPLVSDMYSSPVSLNYSAVSSVMGDLLQKVKAFSADLYATFMDFIGTLSSILQQNNVHLNTEELSSLPEVRSDRIRSIQLQRLHVPIVSRQDIREACQQLQRRRLRVEPQINESIAFLEFLKEVLCASDANVSQLGEILAQTDTISRLMSELIRIIADYEKITKI